MRKRILIACDLEGVNNVVGSAYEGLYRGTDEWKKAKRQAALEINAAADVLFGSGVENVDLWDNHGGGGNIDADDLDPRVKLLSVDPTRPRMYFGGDYDCVFYFGYHAMEGTLGGVLALTMNSKAVQHYKLNGKYIGEIDMDAIIAASHGLPSCLFVGGDIACSQAKRAVPGIVTAVTKHEVSRNEAVFRDNRELFRDIREAALRALNSEVALPDLTFPFTFEKSFKRTEDAAIYIENVRSLGIKASYPCEEILGFDAHTVVSKVENIDELINCI